MVDHDGGYKRLFSHPEMMADLLRGFVREDWVADLDFTSLTKYPTTFINEQLRERRDDVIWRLRRDQRTSTSTCCWNSSPGLIPTWQCGCSITWVCSIRT